MALTDNQYDQIDAYIGGTMSSEETAKFLDAVAADKELQDELEFQKFLYDKQDFDIDEPSLAEQENAGYKQNREMIAAIAAEHWNSEKKTETTKLVPMKWNRLLVAASVTVVVGLSIAGLYHVLRDKGNVIVINPSGVDTGNKKPVPAQQTENEKLLLAYNEYHSIYEVEGSVPADLQNPALKIKNKNWEEGFEEAKNITTVRGSQNEKTATYSMFYQGICLLELNKPAAAYQSLKTAFNNRRNAEPIGSDIAWYFALACLKSNNKEEALSALDTLTTKYPPGKYTTKATSLAATLKGL